MEMEMEASTAQEHNAGLRINPGESVKQPLCEGSLQEKQLRLLPELSVW